MAQREVVILSGARTPIGTYGGSLKDIPPTDLAARVVREAVARAKVDPKDVGQCVFGNVIHTEPKDMYLSRVACVNGGLPHDSRRAHAEPTVRQRTAGDRVGVAIHPARRHRRRGRRRRREHEPRRLPRRRSRAGARAWATRS